MNLETKISPELWNAVQESYESENFAHAIKDAMAFVTEVLRDKSGLDGDGVSLVGQALGFGQNKQPRIRVNKLRLSGISRGRATYRGAPLIRQTDDSL